MEEKQTYSIGTSDSVEGLIGGGIMFEIDWDKIKNIEDIKNILKLLSLKMTKDIAKKSNIPLKASS